MKGNSLQLLIVPSPQKLPIAIKIDRLVVHLF